MSVHKLLISHRGNLNGQDLSTENSPKQIDLALKKGFDVELDLWFHENDYWIGHDSPQYKIDLSFLLDRKEFLFVHLKSPLDYFDTNEIVTLNWFIHTTEPYVYSNLGTKWYYPSKDIFNDGVNVMPEITIGKDSLKKLTGVSVCSDYIERLL